MVLLWSSVPWSDAVLCPVIERQSFGDVACKKYDL